MTDLADFLLARIAEDEALARAGTQGPWIFDGQGFASPSGEPFVRAPHHELEITEEDEAHIMRWIPARVLAECDAKRRLLAEIAEWRGTDTLKLCAERVARHVALPYADHPDYRQEWRP